MKLPAWYHVVHAETHRTQLITSDLALALRCYHGPKFYILMEIRST
jgi:hypothetical protein